MINVADFTGSLQMLLAEAFGVSDAPSGFFLDRGRDGLLGTLDEISAHVASRKLKPQDVTIAAQAGHVLFLLHMFEMYNRGEQPTPDWASSWRVDSVDDASWAELRSDLRASYERVMTFVAENTHWEQRAIGAYMMLLAHCAFHLGSIRQLLTSFE